MGFRLELRHLLFEDDVLHGHADELAKCRSRRVGRHLDRRRPELFRRFLPRSQQDQRRLLDLLRVGQRLGLQAGRSQARGLFPGQHVQVKPRGCLHRSVLSSTPVGVLRVDKA